jgi:hypothetical protein
MQNADFNSAFVCANRRTDEHDPQNEQSERDNSQDRS